MTPAPTEGEHVGALLREAREALGLDLQEIATPLRIRLAYLQAIEDGRFHDLPGPTYAIGFVRTYADYMGMDCDALVAGYKASVGETAGHQELVFPTPVPEGRFPGGSVISLSVVLAVLAFGGWFFLQDRQVAEIGRVPPPPTLASVPNPTDPDGTAGTAGDAAATGPRTEASAPSSQSARDTDPAVVSADRPAATSLATSVASAATAEIGGTSDVGVGIPESGADASASE
ncbi:MAG: helix-turn-helix domain-containing protein, partial [Alphaproteobacteria bacterium]